MSGGSWQKQQEIHVLMKIARSSVYPQDRVKQFNLVTETYWFQISRSLLRDDVPSTSSNVFATESGRDAQNNEELGSHVKMYKIHGRLTVRPLYLPSHAGGKFGFVFDPDSGHVVPVF